MYMVFRESLCVDEMMKYKSNYAMYKRPEDTISAIRHEGLSRIQIWNVAHSLMHLANNAKFRFMLELIEVLVNLELTIN